MAEKRSGTRSKQIKLTSRPGQHGRPPARIHWGAAEAKERGPVIATLSHPEHRNAIGTHAGAYAVYRALAIAAGSPTAEDPVDLVSTTPTHRIGPHPQWSQPDKIVSLDPWGAAVNEVFGDWLKKGYDIRPSIAITSVHLRIAEIREAIEQRRLTPDGKLLKANGDALVTKVAIGPVWYLPGIARRFGCTDAELRRTLFEQTGGMFPELVTRGDLDVFLPPIGGQTVYVLGDPSKLGDPAVPLTCRVHDECEGSDVLGSDRCTCRVRLIHGIEECIRDAQAGGTGLVVYNRREGGALGQELMPDPLHWLGVSKIDRFVSASEVKHDALVRSGIEIVERVRIPDALVGGEPSRTGQDREPTKGRSLRK